MNVAILGATSQVAKDLTCAWLMSGKYEKLYLYARKPQVVISWLKSCGFDSGKAKYTVEDIKSFGQSSYKYDAIVNAIGFGAPERIKAAGISILEVSDYYDNLCLSYLNLHKSCRYIFFSSGAVFGKNLNAPVTLKSKSVHDVNALNVNDMYSISKLYAEAKHRAFESLNIVDVRIFNIFSATQNMSERFLMTDIVRSIKTNEQLYVDPENLIRDYIHPSDFKMLVDLILCAKPCNSPVDCYSLKPVNKWDLLDAMHKEFNLDWRVQDNADVVNVTGKKNVYMSTNKKAFEFGFSPRFDSLGAVMDEMRKIFK